MFNWEREGGGRGGREREREGGIIFSYKRKNRLQLASLSLCSSLWQVFEQKIPSDCSRILYFLVSKIVRFIESEIKLLIPDWRFWSYSAYLWRHNCCLFKAFLKLFDSDSFFTIVRKRVQNVLRFIQSDQNIKCVFNKETRVGRSKTKMSPISEVEERKLLDKYHHKNGQIRENESVADFCFSFPQDSNLRNKREIDHRSCHLLCRLNMKTFFMSKQKE